MVPKMGIIKLCEHAEESIQDKKMEEFNKKHVFEPAEAYLIKLQVVLKYSYPTTQWRGMIPAIDELEKCDSIGFLRDFPSKITAKDVEELYDKICQKKHPFWSLLKPFGISADVKPEDVDDSRPGVSGLISLT